MPRKKDVTELHVEFVNNAEFPSYERKRRFPGFVLTFAQSGGHAYIPFVVEDGKPEYDTISIFGFEWYMVFTSSDETALWPWEAFSNAPMSDLLDKTLSNPDVVGICFNPSNKHRIFLSNEQLKTAISLRKQ